MTAQMSAGEILRSQQQQQPETTYLSSQQRTNQQTNQQQANTTNKPDSLLSNTCLELALEGERLIKAGDFKSGITFLEEAIKVGTNDEGQLSAICSQLGNAYFLLEDYQKALEYHKKDVDILHRIGDEEAEAKACGNLGNTFKMLGKFDDAAWYCKRHLEITRKLCDEVGTSKALYNLGNIYHVKGKRMITATGQEPGELSNDMRSSLKEAISYYEENLAVVTKLNDYIAMGRAYGNLGNTHYMLGNFDLAVESHKQRLELAMKTGDKSAQRRAHLNLGNANVFLGNYSQAIENYTATLDLSQKLEDKSTEAHSCYSLANTYAIQKNYDSAIKFHLRHLELAHESGDKLGEGQSCCMLVKICEKVDDLESALKFAKKHYEIAEQLGDKDGLTTALSNIKAFEETISQKQAFQLALSMSKQQQRQQQNHHHHRQQTDSSSSCAKIPSAGAGAASVARGSIPSSSSGQPTTTASSSSTNKKTVLGFETAEAQAHCRSSSSSFSSSSSTSKATAFDIHRLSPDKRQEKDLRRFKKQLNSDLTGVVRSSSSERLFDMIAHFQSGRIDDQRCEIFQRPIPAAKTTSKRSGNISTNSRKPLLSSSSSADAKQQHQADYNQGFRGSYNSCVVENTTSGNKENMSDNGGRHNDESCSNNVDPLTKENNASENNDNNNNNNNIGRSYNRSSQPSIVNPMNAVSAAASAIKSTYRKASLAAYPLSSSNNTNTLTASIQAQRRPTVSAEHREQLFDLIAGAQGQRMDEQRASLPALTLANGLLKNPTNAGLLSHRAADYNSAKKTHLPLTNKPSTIIEGRPKKERSQSIMHPTPAAAVAAAAVANANAASKTRTVDDDTRLFNRPRAHKLTRHFQTVDADSQVHDDKFLDSLMKYQSTRFNDQRSEFPKKQQLPSNNPLADDNNTASTAATTTTTTKTPKTTTSQQPDNKEANNQSDFFNLIVRFQSDRIDDQRSAPPTKK